MTTNDVTTLDIPAKLRYLQVIGNLVVSSIEALPFAKQIADIEMTTYSIQLAVHEISTNIIEHAYADSTLQCPWLRLKIRHENQGILHIVLEDAGNAFDPSQVRETAPDALQERGFGLSITHQIMDSVTYQRLDGTNHWHLSKQLLEQ
jgi:serine/threonine-protein kinase RsbW